MGVPARPKIGDVILVLFPFSDFSALKERPVLVVANAEFDDLIICQITSKSYSSKISSSLGRADFASGGLEHDSFIRPDKLFTLDKKLALKNLGSIKKSKLNEVLLALQKLFAKN